MGLFDFLFGGQKKVGGEGFVNMEDVNQLRNQQALYNQQLGDLSGQINAFTPEAATASFLANSPALQQAVMGSTSDYAKQQMGMADTMGRQATQGVFDQFANQGASARSGAAIGAATQAGMVPYQQAIGNIMGQQQSLASQLLGAAQQQPYQQAQLALGQQGNIAGLQQGVNSQLNPIYQQQEYEQTRGLIPTITGLMEFGGKVGRAIAGIPSFGGGGSPNMSYDPSADQKNWTGRQ